MKVLITEKLSPNKYIDNSGYLICKDAILARTGSQQYRKNELFLDSDDNSIIEVDRSEEEVFSPETLASFENKPVTVEHPGEDVNPENYKEYSVGFVRDVHRGKTEAGEDVILGTLVITDQDTIENIQKGIRTELSCGYDCDISDDNNGNYAQCHIRGNHVALCEEGRAGIAKIVDSKIHDSNVILKLSDTYSMANIQRRAASLGLMTTLVDYNGSNYEVRFTGNDSKIKNLIESFDNDGILIEYPNGYKPKDSKIKDSKYDEYRKLLLNTEDKKKLREIKEQIEDDYDSDLLTDNEYKRLMRTFDNMIVVSDSKVNDSYYVVACSEGDLWYNEQGKPDKFENAKRFSTYEEADRFRNSGKDGSVNKINDSELKDVDWLEQAKRFSNEPHFSWGFKNEVEAKTIANKASNYNVIASKVNPIMYVFTGVRENLIRFIKDNFSQPHYAIAAIKDSKLKDGDWEETEWFEFTADNCKYSFVKGGYGMKFASKADYDRSKNYAKKIHYTGGQWDDKDLTYWDFRSTVISNDSKANDSYKMYKGYAIEYDFYGEGECTVQYAGDDIWFKTEAEAKKFIDEITSEKAKDSKQQIVDALSKIYHKVKDSTIYMIEVLYPDGTLYKKFKIEHDGVYDSEVILKNFFRAYPEYKNDPWLVQITK